MIMKKILSKNLQRIFFLSINTIFCQCLKSCYTSRAQNNVILRPLVAFSTSSRHIFSVKMTSMSDEHNAYIDEIVSDEERLKEWLRKAAKRNLQDNPDKSEGEEELESTQPERINIVLTHTTADFDSLASAVGLAKLWNAEDPLTKSFVVMPRGSHPIVQTFLALHRNLFPLLPLKDVEPLQVNRLGIVDAHKRERIKPAVHLLESAREIHIYDHHIGDDCDIDASTKVIEKVGSVSTIVTHLLREAKLSVSDTEATLLALGIHGDTGSLLFDNSTPKDAEALAWLMGQGASQLALAEFVHTAMSPEQEEVFSEAFHRLKRTNHDGTIIATILLGCNGFINGLSRVAQNVLELTNCDVLLMCAVYSQKVGKEANNMVVIGRARPRMEVNLDLLFGNYGGGGHPKAAALSVKIDDPMVEGRTPEEFVDHLVQVLCESQIKAEVTAGEFMTAPVLTVFQNDTISKADQLIKRNDIEMLPIVDEENNIKGAITRTDIAKALKQGNGERPVKGYMNHQVSLVDIGTKLQEITRVLTKEEHTKHTQILVTENGKLAGLITRTDLLREYKFYSSIHYHNKAFSMRLDNKHRKFIMGLRKRLKKFDVEE